MRRVFANLPIRAKIGLALGISTVGSLLLAVLVLVIFELSTLYGRGGRQLSGLADTLSVTLRGPVDFADSAEAARTLGALESMADIVQADLFLPDGTLFASYRRAGVEFDEPPDLGQDGFERIAGELRLVRTLERDGEEYGRLVLRSNLRSERNLFANSVFILLGLAFIMSVVAAILASILQRSMGGPLLRLAATARSITGSHDYSLRTYEGGRDEIATLAMSFNHMLAELGRNEAALRASEERLRLALDAARMGTWSWDIPTNQVTWSERIEPIFGLKPGEFAGTYEAYLATIPEDERDRVVAVINGVLAKPDEDYHIQHRVVSPGGESRWVEARGRVFCDAGGRPVRMAGTVVDATAQRRAADAWQVLSRVAAAVGEAFFRSLVRDLATVLGADFCFVGELRPGDARVGVLALWARGQVGENFEYELAGTPCEDVMSTGLCILDERLQETYPDDPMLATMGVRAYYGIVLRSAGGGPIGLLVVMHSRPLEDAAMVRSLLSVFAGRAGSELERLKTEKALRETEARIRGVGDNLPNGMIYQLIALPGGGRRFTYVSGNVERIHGVSVDAVLSDARVLYDQLVAEEQERFRAAEAEAIRTLGIFNFETRVRLPSGVVRWVQMTSSPRPGSDGAVIFDGVEIDVTERRRAEEDLRQSQKMETVGQLAGGVAHDFNNMLQAIIGFATMARDPSVAVADREECIGEILAAAARAGDITRQLLVFSRQQPVVMDTVEIGELARNIIKLVRRLIGETIELHCTTGPQPVHVNADRTQIEQVLINLCVNARDAMNDGGRIVIETHEVAFEPSFVESHPWAQAGRFAEIVVRDNGSGMDRETLSHIFEPFFTTKGKDKGTGLGLSVVYGIVQQHEGFLRVYSEPRLGTTVHVYLPCIEAPPVKPDTPARPPAAGSGETILLAEDEASVRAMVERLLRRAGYNVIAASDGEEAVRLFTEHREKVDLLLFDAVMPRMSGPEAHRRICAMQGDVPAVFCSGYSEELATRGGTLPAHAKLLQKPYSLDALLAAIDEVLDRR